MSAENFYVKSGGLSPPLPPLRFQSPKKDRYDRVNTDEKCNTK